MLSPNEVSKDCDSSHVADKADFQLFTLKAKTAAESKTTDLKAHVGKYMCRRCMVLLAAKYALDLDNDFQTREQIVADAEREQTTQTAFSEFLEWLENYGLLPDVQGRPPQQGRLHLCRQCGEPLSNDDLFVFDKRFLSTLHPDLGDNSKRPSAKLAGRAMCKVHFEEVKAEIAATEVKHNLPRSRLEEGRAWNRLSTVFDKAKRRSY